MFNSILMSLILIYVDDVFVFFHGELSFIEDFIYFGVFLKIVAKFE